MGSIKHQQACMECTKKCLKTHGRKLTPDSNSTPLSFFKIMVGDFREVLFIPPKFDLLDESFNHNIYLEDSDGNSSRVKLSMKDGCLVFQDGWREFVLDHSIEVGEFVIFKYVGEFLFSVQIFGVSACERVCFHDKNKSSSRKKNINKADLSLEELQLPKRYKCSGDLKDKCHLVNENSLNKEQESKDDLSDLPDIEFIGSNCAEKDENESEKSPHCLGNSEGTQSEMALGLNKQSRDKIDEVAMRVQEEGSSVPMGRPETHGMDHKDSVHEQETSTIPSINDLDPKAMETDTNPDDADIAMLNEEKIFHCDDNCRRSQTAPTIECTKSTTENQMNSSWDIIIYTPKNDCSKEPGIAEKHPMRNQGVHKIDTVHLADDLKMLENENRNLIAKDKSACKFLLTEEGVCHIFDESLTVEHEASRITPIILYVSENNCVNNNGGCCDEIIRMPREEASSKSKNIPEVSCPESTPDPIKVEKCEEIRESLHSEEGLCSLAGNTPIPLSRNEDAPFAGSVGSAPQNLPHMDITEGKTRQSGMLPDDFMEEDEENITPYLKEKTLKAVKAERMDSDGVDEQSSPKLISLSFTLSSNARSWTLFEAGHTVSAGIVPMPYHFDGKKELPQTLPYRLGKKRHGMRVVTLQDPSMRQWPVLYHESLKFVGFLGGWKDFAVANNLQQGNMCEIFEVSSEWEPTFQVRISKL
ncbi:B3 domain-containing protein Os02g0598200-like isoform X1 [Phoenix dactylifera]|uniref:B3 domain-containing protein Os02g0598200-like isoform X1 n=1 Tax=Phoenix dactylifera TaxID=42345 RepID=A0A8B9ASB9_PHODC|nr:B3 domain-containing protein Os02g0598200-like isoform X1 [Phoenix dactylifera]